jgi:phosphoglycolate phosphatase
VAAARRAVDVAWFVPDPVATARPVTDLAPILDAIQGSRRTIALATTDDRAPTTATLVALGVRDRFAALACGDDGVGVKPDPRMLLAICEATRILPERTAVIGDTPTDLEMGRRAGAGRVIGVQSGVGERVQLEPLADVLLPSIAALVEA